MFDILGWLNYLLDSLKNMFFGFFQSIWDLFKDLFLWLFDACLGIVDHALALVFSIFPDMSGVAAQWGNLPGEMIWFASALGVDVALGMIVSALIVRLIVMAIPFFG